jgi:hypothetical protein
MTARTMIGIAALLCVSIGGLVSTFWGFEIVDRVNEKLPKEERFESLGWYTEKTLRLYREYKRLYPDGRLVLKVYVIFAFMIMCLLICAWGFRIFAR